MTILVVCKETDGPRWVEGLRAALPQRRVDLWPSYGSPLTEVKYVLAWKPPGDLWAKLPNLAGIFSLGAGVDHIFAAGEPPKDVPVIRIVDSDLTGRMCEYVVLHVLLHHRRHLAYEAAQRAEIWQERDQPVAGDIRVGILGFGVLGRASARILSNLGFQIAGWRRGTDAQEEFEVYSGLEMLNSFLNRTDILVNLLPLTGDTENFLTHEKLGQLARDGKGHGPVLINAGRGATQNEDDVLRALRDGTIKSASLDVFCDEPLPNGHALWQLDNVIITPHIAAYTEPATLVGSIARQIKNFEAGQGFENIVDTACGY